MEICRYFGTIVSVAAIADQANAAIATDAWQGYAVVTRRVRGAGRTELLVPGSHPASEIMNMFH
jgi:hypothetical protein